MKANPETPDFPGIEEKSYQESIEESPYNRFNELSLQVSAYEGQLEHSLNEVRENGTEEQVQEAMTIMEGFRRMARKEVQALILAVTALTPNHMWGAHEQLIPGGATVEDIQHAYEAQDSSVEQAIEELREGIWTDGYESAQMLLGHGVEFENIFKTKGNDSMVRMSPADESKMAREIDSLSKKLEKDDIPKQVWLHNHPAPVGAKLPGYDEERIKDMQEGKVPPATFPPSFGDLLEQVMYTGDNIPLDTIHYVIEPSGTWRYDFDETHPAVKAVSEINRKIENSVGEVIKEHEAEQEHLKERAEEAMPGVSYQETEDDAAQSYDKLQEKIVQNALEVHEELEDMIGSEKYQLVRERMPDLAHSIRDWSYNGYDVTAYIHQYVDTARELGINIDYVSNDGTYISYKEVGEPEGEPGAGDAEKED